MQQAQQTTWAVDGLFLTQRVSGIQRYSLELLAALDDIAPPGLVEVVVPRGVAAPAYRNLRVVPFGGRRGLAWEQLDYPRYLHASGRRGLCTCNVIPVLGFRGMAVVHDVCYRARPDFYTAPRARLSALWHRLQYRLIARNAEKIITVSEFSKQELQRYYQVPADRIAVVYNAWQQMERVKADETVFDRHPELARGGYWFSMSNLLKNKNFPWVLEAARRNPGEVFAIAGGGSLSGVPGADRPNVKLLGYVTDGEAKALMAGCKGFLFPTLYEGFGIPPLEAIAAGAPAVLVSDTPCMREIYRDCAGYIDLAAPPGDLTALRPSRRPAAELLQRYSWQKSARTLLELLQEPRGKADSE